jgi:phage-related protein
MATLPDIAPTYGISKSSKPNVRIAQFGSGYEQRTTFGLNQNPKTWDMTWENLSETDADTLENFLNARAGVETFEWTPPDDTTQYIWVCSEWSKELTNPNISTVTATFRQVFEP